jgi:hypothetical protein
MRPTTSTSIVGMAAALGGTLVLAQGAAPYRLSRDHAAIQYSTRPTRDAVSQLNERLDRGEVPLEFEAPPRGYLRSVLDALAIPLSSQVLVFSENSLQGKHIGMSTPRAIYFNDTAAVSWAKGADSIEAAVLDPSQGIQFYSMDQKGPTFAPTAQTATAGRQFVKRTDCLQCHLGAETAGVPGLVAMSVLPLSDNQLEYAQGWSMDHRTPIEDRWGGWYVTGKQVPSRHLGNVAVMHVPKSYVRAEVAPRLATGSEAFDTRAYLTPHSDVAALLVFNHQLHMTNLLIRLGWEARIAEHGSVAQGFSPATRLPDFHETVAELVDYMLFVDEAPLPSPVEGSTSFAADFSSRGPRDRKGRSLRDLDLSRRLLRYPCSYMIYSEAFDALPDAARSAVYDRLWSILSGRTSDALYARLSPADRAAIIEILRETKSGLPDYFKSTVSTQ